MATRKSTNRRTPAANKPVANTVTKEEMVDDSKVVEETGAPESTETKVEPDQSGGDAEGESEAVQVEGVEDKSAPKPEEEPEPEPEKTVKVSETQEIDAALTKVDPAKERAERAKLRQKQLAAALKGVEKLPDNIATHKANGEQVTVEEKPVKADEPRPAIFDQIDRVMLPFVEKMMPGIRSTEKEQGDLHHSVAMLIRALLIKGETDMKIGIPYLFGYYNRYSSSVFHPQNHHRGVGAMRGTEDDINFYRNVSRLFADIADPKAAAKVLERTDIAHFKKLTMATNTPAAAKIATNLSTVISRVKTPK